jgi:spermidine synthase
MKPWELLGETETPDGTLMALTRRGHEHVLLADGKALMSSRARGSEEELARLGCERAAEQEAPRVLIGGLGMGFTLRAALDVLPADATVVVAEIIPELVAWNRGPLGPLADHPLDDRRVQVEVGDVADALREGVGRFDAVLLDVDNGPVAFTVASNDTLYRDGGIALCHAALRPGGVLAVWSAWDDRKYEHRLRHRGFEVETHRVRARLHRGGPRHTLFIGRR